MDRRGFIRTGVGAFFARFIPKPALMPSVVPKTMYTSYLVGADAIFVKNLKDNFPLTAFAQKRDLPAVKTEFKLFAYQPLKLEIKNDG